MYALRRLVTVVDNCVLVVEPKLAYRTPPVEPVNHRSVPLVDAAPRGLPALAKSVSAVLVSTTPSEPTRNTTRLVAADVVPAMLAVPGAAA